jgi:hypothetical protein
MEIDRSKIRATLLTVYAQNTISQIDDFLIASTFFPGIAREETQSKMEKLTRDDLYLSIKEELQTYKTNIEEELARSANLSLEDEIKTVLYRVVLNLAIFLGYDQDPGRYDSKMQLLHDLIKATFIDSGSWNPKLAAHFTFVFPILRDWYSFFISYTNKQAYDINMRFAAILSLNPVSTTTNQVARHIAEQLRFRSLPKAFIDEKELEYGNNFKSKIDSAINHSHTFVQVISEATFFTIGATNWCQYEFEKYKHFLDEQQKDHPFYYQAAMSDTVFFFIVGSSLDDVLPPLPLTQHRKWLQDIAAVEYIKFYSGRNNQAVGQAVQDYEVFTENIKALAIAIIKAKKRLIDSIPAG